MMLQQSPNLAGIINAMNRRGGAMESDEQIRRVSFGGVEYEEVLNPWGDLFAEAGAWINENKLQIRVESVALEIDRHNGAPYLNLYYAKYE